MFVPTPLVEDVDASLVIFVSTLWLFFGVVFMFCFPSFFLFLIKKNCNLFVFGLNVMALSEFQL